MISKLVQQALLKGQNYPYPNIVINNSYYGNGLQGAGNVYVLVLSSWKVNIAKKDHCRMGL